MKFLVAFVAFALFVSAQALSEAQKERVRGHHKVCLPETGVDNELVQKMRGGDFSIKDDKLNAYVLCMLKRSGVMNAEGDFLRDAALERVEESLKDKVAKAIDACLGETGATKEERAFNYLKCYHKERPDHDVV